MRLVPALLIAACVALPSLADSPDSKPVAKAETEHVPGQEPGVYRYGATYSYNFMDSAAACQNACNEETACFAWSYVEGLSESNSRCELKRSGGRVERNALATSGISKRHEDLFVPPTVPSELEGAPEDQDLVVSALTVPPAPSGKPGPTPLVTISAE